MNNDECEQRAKEMATKLLRANADALEVQYAVGQLIPLYEMISEDDDIFIAPGSKDFTFGSLISDLISKGFTREERAAGLQPRQFYACSYCGGHDANRPIGQRPQIAAVIHGDGCLLNKHLPRLRAMANRDVT